MYKVIVVEDELTNSLLLKRLLTKAGYQVAVTHNGADALKQLERESFDVILTDWMMPQVDGIELIRKVRENIKPIPYIIMVTALVSESAKNYALESGADDYIAKPIDIDELLSRVKDGIKKQEQTETPPKTTTEIIQVDTIPPFVACAIATSTGGPPTLIQFFKDIDTKTPATYFVVQHGPSWMLETFSQRLQRETALKVHIGQKGMKVETEHIYIAPGDYHMKINAEDLTIELDNGPKENFVRPAADPLFRSVAKTFGKYMIATILTGLGKDGTQGVSYVKQVGGKVYVQDPDTAVAPAMPRNVIEAGYADKIISLQELGNAINNELFNIDKELKKAKK